MKKIKVTREWAKDRLACRKSVRRFFGRWPRGLTLNRRNLCLAADQLPMSDLLWFASMLRLGGHLDRQQFDAMYALAYMPNGGCLVRSSAKKQAFAKAFADMLGL